jgi:hypothetical protein
MLPLVVAATRVRVVGVVVGVLRRQGFRPSGRRAVRPVPCATDDGATLDLALASLGRSLREAEARAAERRGPESERLRELARSLRALRDCYLETTTPRLRRALLDEASGLMARLRRVRPRLRSTSNP